MVLVQLCTEAHDGLTPVVLAEPNQSWRTRVWRVVACCSGVNPATGVQSGVEIVILIIMFTFICWLLYGYHNNMRVGDHKVVIITFCYGSINNQR